MKAISGKFISVFAASAMALTVVVAAPVSGAVHSFAKAYTITATIKGGKDLTVLLMSGSGQLLASQSLSDNNQKITLKSPPTASIAGTTLQLISGVNAAAKGKYYGPVVLGNKSSSAAKSSIVYTRLKQTASTLVRLGTIAVKTVPGTTQQGYGVTSKKSPDADTSTSASVKAYKGKPIGVGTYGKTAGVAIKSYGVSAAAIGDPCSPAGTPTCDLSGREKSPQDGPPPTGQPTTGLPTTTTNTAIDKEKTLGGDPDDDGIPSAFDVNDDGDGYVDSADSDTPSTIVGVAGSTSCAALNFRVFTNLKATERDFLSTINAYGATGTKFEATPARSAEMITSTMSMVFLPIKNVCGSNVTATYLKGNGAAYAPTEYVKLPDPCDSTKDYEWEIGLGKMCPSRAGNTNTFSFASPFTFTDKNLPSGQDTFTMKLVTADGNEYEFTSSPGFVFVTHPMLVSYDNGAGATGTIPYGQSNIAPIPVTSDKELTLTLYRPQRLAFDGEDGFAEGAYYDLAGFSYSADLPSKLRTTLGPTGPTEQGPGQCDQVKYTDTQLANDTRANKSSKLTLTLKWKIKDCLRGFAWTAGYLDIDIKVLPTGPGGNSAQKLFVQLLTS